MQAPYVHWIQKAKIGNNVLLLISATLSLLVYIVFYVIYNHHEEVRNITELEDEHQVIQALFSPLNYLDNPHLNLFETTISIPDEVINNQSYFTELSQKHNLDFINIECISNANRQPMVFKPGYFENNQITLITYDLLKLVVWSEYYGYVRASRPCFNATRDKAIIYVEWVTSFSRYTEIILFFLHGREWKRIDEIMTEGTYII